MSISSGLARGRGAVVAVLVGAWAAGGPLERGWAQAPPAPGRAATQAALPRVEGDRLILPEGWMLRPARTKPAPTLPEKVTHAFVIPIREEIGGKTADAVTRKVLRCRTAGAQLVVFDINTPGGESEAMKQILRCILDDLPGAYTVAYAHPEAMSAGAIISLACDEIVMSPTGLIGDAMPILITPGGGIVDVPKEIRGKIESYAEGQARVLCQQNGYDQVLCQAMISSSMEVWLVRSRRTGELRIVDRAKWREPLAGMPGTAPSEGLFQPQAEWEYVDTIDGPDKPLSLTGVEALRLGLAGHLFEDMSALSAHYRVAGELRVLEDTWSEGLVGFLTHPAVLGFLFFVAVLCAYIEINTPGFGIPGTIAILCFAVIFGSRYLTGLAQVWEVGLFVVGVILLLVEIFVTPGFGVVGTLGIICCVVGLAGIVIPNPPDRAPWPETKLDWDVFSNGLLGLALGFLGAVAGTIVVARYLPKTPVAGKLVLAAPRVEPRPPTAETAPILAVHAGQGGRVVQVCRPVGKVLIAGQLLDAVADGAFLPAGEEVVVLRNEGNRVVVQPKPTPPSA